MRLLLVEDEPSLRESVARKLHRAGYETDDCGDGETALEMLAAERYDLVLLDLNLPLVDGMTVLRTLRKTDLETPVLILSARSEIADKVEGLDAGANDYLAKPFHLAELEARVRSLTRRQFIQRDVCLRCGRLSFDTKEPGGYGWNGQPVTTEPARKAVVLELYCFCIRDACQSGGIDGTCLGRTRRCVQQFDSGAYLGAAQKAAHGTGV